MAAKKTASNILVWGILVLLVVGLGGFGVTNFGGNIRSIGKVGDVPIDIQTYARQLTQEIGAFEAQMGQQISITQAEAFGLPTVVQGQVIAAAALDNEAQRIGLSVGDDQVRADILGTSGFVGINGTFDREAYRFALQRNGWTEAEYEALIRAEAARDLLRRAVLGGVGTPASYSDAYAAYLGEQRSFAQIILAAEDLAEPVGQPDEAALEAYYSDNPAAYTLPEAREITYAWLSPDMLTDEIEVSEDDLRALYDDRLVLYQRPERRLVERLVYPDQASADAAKARLDAGEITFEDLVEARGLELSDIDLGDVTRDELGAAGAAVFALTSPGVAGPADTDLGPALFRMNAVLLAQNTPFEDARDELAEDLAQDAARRRVTDLSAEMDDLLAAGATLEELAEETPMQLGTLRFDSRSEEDIAGYPAFRQAAEAVQEGDFPELADLEDGGIFALRLDGIVAPELQPLDAVRDQAIADWQEEQTRQRLGQEAEGLKARLEAGEAIGDLGRIVETTETARRDGISPPLLAETVFAMQPGNARVLELGETVRLVQLTGVTPADPADPDLAPSLQQLGQQTAQQIQQDIFARFSEELTRQGGLELDQAAINAVHSQIQ